MLSDNEFYKNIDLSDMGDFHAYVTGLEDWHLIFLIEDTYLWIKNRCKYAPKLGENVCIEFAEALLLRRYLQRLDEPMEEDTAYTQQDIEKVKHKLNEVSFAIGMGFMGATTKEWKNLTESFFNDSYFLSRKEWNVVYMYLRDYYADDIRKLEFNKGNIHSNYYIRSRLLKKMASTSSQEELIRYFYSRGLMLLFKR